MPFVLFCYNRKWLDKGDGYMDIKLIALDLDGTLLNDQKEIDQPTIDALLKAQEKGISIAIATGRSKGSIEFVSQPLHLYDGNNFVVGVNGQIIYDFANKEYFVDKVFDGYDAQKCMELGEKMGFEVTVCCGHDAYRYAPKAWRVPDSNELMYEGAYADFGLKPFKRNTYDVFEVDEWIDKDVNKFVFRQSKEFFLENIETIRKCLPDYDVLMVGSTWIEVMPKGVSKASGLAYVANLLGINAKNIMAFGDAENDIDMFNYVGYPIAMGNAMDNVKDIAYDVTDTNISNGIAKAIEKYIL